MRREISKNRILEDHDGFVVITPKTQSQIQTPLFCPVCSRIMSGLRDVLSFNDMKCCETCDTFWARLNVEKWKNGDRPSREDVESNIEKRNLDLISVVTCRIDNT